MRFSQVLFHVPTTLLSTSASPYPGRRLDLHCVCRLESRIISRSMVEVRQIGISLVTSKVLHAHSWPIMVERSSTGIPQPFRGQVDQRSSVSSISRSVPKPTTEHRLCRVGPSHRKCSVIIRDLPRANTEAGVFRFSVL
ncbi:uncharacterized protein BDW70DRAFT_6270 [Aspergillus foveolatus]|uniref:uncharacterized protein n=1 Tax=Aspergillus foveolatus TaxID=210207 RepID=UPI003CCD9FBC